MAIALNDSISLAEVSDTVMQNGSLNLEELVANATWRELLIDLVATNKIDPWDVDLVQVVDSYIGAVKRMKVLDLRIPANMILAASILLRLKSETINLFEEPEPEPSSQEEAAPGGRILPSIPELTPKFRMQPRRKITLDELINALEGAMKAKERRADKITMENTPMEFIVNMDDIDEKIESAFGLVRKSVDRKSMVTFMDLSRGMKGSESVLLDLFVPLLFLATDSKITMFQEEFFGEIIIKLLKQGDGTGAG